MKNFNDKLLKYNLRGNNRKKLADNILPISFQITDWESLDYDPYEEEQFESKPYLSFDVGGSLYE